MGGHESAASRVLGWFPALLLAQLAFAILAASRALPTGEWSLPIVATATGNQLLFLLRALPLLFLLTWPLAALRGARSRLLAVGVLWSLLLLLQATLEQYYLVSRVPLGADLFGYSLVEIRTTISGTTGSAIGWVDWVCLLLPLVLLWSTLVWRAGSRTVPRPVVLSALLLVGAVTWLLPMAVGVRGLGSDAARDIATSKGSYFVADSLRWWRSTPMPLASVAAGPGAGKAPMPQNPNYPFLHTETTPDALGSYFGPTSDGQPPNLVVIVVEGLGRSFSGPDAPFGSFTPFLDELGARSLYFNNILANQGRTFGVLPALLGSLPLANEGFSALGPKMPTHAGLFNVLDRQGYHSVFYMGTDSSFDNERGFLQLQGVDDIVDLSNFGPGYQRNPFNEWGYPDRELVSRILADSAQLQPPFVMGMQTISMHTNYEFPGQAVYKARVEQRLGTLGISAARKPGYSAHANIYSAILYTDDQLRRYFEAVKNEPWHANTIFVITGDHRLPEIPQDTYIERYHVPLIIYSPLLRKPARIRGVSSHMDVTPSLLALLSHTYGLQRPAHVTWTGSGLDMATTFRSVHDFPIKQTKTSTPDFVSGRWFLHDNRLFELQDGMRATEIDDAGVRTQVAQRLQRYVAANTHFLSNLVLSPEGGLPKLVAFNAAASAAVQDEPVIGMLPAGLGLAEVKLTHTAAGVKVVATFINGDATDSATFAPLAVLAAEDGRELREGYGSAIRLHAHERRDVVLLLAMPALAPGRYFVSVLPSDPNSGKPIGRGNFHIPLEITAAAQ